MEAVGTLETLVTVIEPMQQVGMHGECCDRLTALSAHTLMQCAEVLFLSLTVLRRLSVSTYLTPTATTRQLSTAWHHLFAVPAPSDGYWV